jgi:hypothetical protein
MPHIGFEFKKIGRVELTNTKRLGGLFIAAPQAVPAKAAAAFFPRQFPEGDNGHHSYNQTVYYLENITKG